MKIVDSMKIQGGGKVRREPLLKGEEDKVRQEVHNNIWPEGTNPNKKCFFCMCACKASKKSI